MKKKRKKLRPYLYLVPMAVLMGIFVIYPLISLFSTSFTKWDGLGAKEFIGIKNYIKAMDSTKFWYSIKLTFVWAILSICILQPVGVVLAVIVENLVKSRRIAGVMRTIYFMPMLMSMVAIGLLWQLIYNPSLGLLTSVLDKLHLVDIMNPPNFLGSKSTVLPAAFIPTIWQWSGFGMILTSAAMMNIPSELNEAAAIDGAGKVSGFFRITLPLLMPTIFLGMTINMIGAFKGFDMLYAMTAGGPANYTTLTSIFIYKLSFTENKFGYACAVSVILIITVIFFTVIFNAIGKKIEEKYT
ncbi:MAG: sugar ABC transporter permease [Eubacteriales bacterium]|nr:sugar ABC transporter permease [Eubacteriales bacterium]